MKEIGVVSWKLPYVKCLANIFEKFSPIENNHVYSTWFTKMIDMIDIRACSPI